MSLTKLFSSPVETGTANIGTVGENAKGNSGVFSLEFGVRVSQLKKTPGY